MKVIRNIGIALFCMAAVALHAQNGTNDPYSQYVFSPSMLPSFTPLASSMGGIVYSRSGSNVVNPFNPASYASIEKESFLFDIALGLSSTTMTSGAEETNAFDGGLSSISVAFPILKFWKTSLGLLPYAQTSYSTVVESPVAGTSQSVKTIYDGNGGISQFYWGNAFNVTGNGDASKPSLQAGFNINYLYGAVERAITYDFVGSDTSYYQDTRRQKDTRVSDVAFDLGLLYRHPLGTDYALTVGLTVKLPRKMTVDDNSLIYTFVTKNGTEYTMDTIFPARGESSEYESTLRQPTSFGLGVALERVNRWQLAIDACYAPYSGMKYEEGLETPVFGNSGLRYNDNYRIAIGGGWIGNPDAAHYIGRMGLTGGIHYERGKLCLALQNGDWTLNEWGVGLGITFPMRKGRSKLLLTCAYSNFGTADLLRSEVLTIGLSFSSNERWFMKRKYN